MRLTLYKRTEMMIEMGKDYGTLLQLTSLIKDKEKAEFVREFLDEKVPGYFKEVPASSSGKYHPESSLGEGGLVRHTITAVKLGYYIINLEYPELIEEEKDDVIAALILHDTFKQGRGDGTGHTVNDHEIIAAEEIKKAGFPGIASLVSTHMGQWGRYSTIKNDLQFYVHLVDYLASRKTISVDLSSLV